MINYEQSEELVKKAKLGDKESLNRLAETARVHLREYVLRLTLREDLTQDIVQESILEMFKVFDKLKSVEKFWPWLDGIAFNKIRKHYGRQWRHKTISISDIDNKITTDESQSALADMINRELKQIVLVSMRELSPRHRAILTMRCYKDMPYSKIAELMGCTEFGAQSLFYRAKKGLAKKLSRHGLGKGYLLPALLLFGKLTASTEAAAANITVTTASLKVGTAASLVGMFTGKTVVISMATAAAITCGTMVISNETSMIDLGPKSINAQNPLGTPAHSISEDIDQWWYFFPDGPGGPVMMRLLSFENSRGKSFCSNLQNQHANYYCEKSRIYVNNCRMYNPDLSVLRLPTDGKDLSRFISRIEGRQADMEYISSKAKGLLVISKRSNEQGDRVWKTDRHFNILEEEYFQFNWPQNAKIIDNRDLMHKRGWTFFRITGRINDKHVSGTGQMPFVYAAYEQNSPWFRLQLEDGLKIIDNESGACVLNQNGKVVATYPAWSFFRGLGRPWMGLHTIDSVRRDAAEKQIWFETKLLHDSTKAEVVLTHEKIRLIYTIDMETDVIEKIAFSKDNDIKGELKFSYLQDIDNLGNEFIQPRIENYSKPYRSPVSGLWLINLFNNLW